MAQRTARGSAAAALAIAEAAHGQRRRSVAGQRPHQLLEQRLQALALLAVEHVEHALELPSAVGQHARGGCTALGGQVEGAGAPVGPWAAVEQAVAGKTIDHLDRSGLRDAQDVGEGLDGVARVGLEVNQRGGVGAGAAERGVHAGANAVAGAEREGTEQLGEAIGHRLLYNRVMCCSNVTSITEKSGRSRPLSVRPGRLELPPYPHVPRSTASEPAAAPLGAVGTW
jgi:hypothetical protein